ncbi:hypothetical protein GWI33_011429 [Rhynchophorus ferrugineus]|uniref:Uncharacterized protein n=1 Tax=Rhynchophorus ferrugineus TaxID=354439 RepID=A0A834MM37_RHYFE|nr:hypothetical protein GWI33_011429 [Rhynchophorus ferrugineus]
MRRERGGEFSFLRRARFHLKGEINQPALLRAQRGDRTNSASVNKAPLDGYRKRPRTPSYCFRLRRARAGPDRPNGDPGKWGASPVPQLDDIRGNVSEIMLVIYSFCTLYILFFLSQSFLGLIFCFDPLEE